jgi:hypothetical protein
MSDEIFNELRVLRSRVENIERGQEVLIRAQKKEILDELLPHFAKDPTLGHVYFLVDGTRGQKQIAEALIVGGRAGSEATVSRKLDILVELDLVALDDRTSSGKIYKKTQFDKALRLSREIEKTAKASEAR